MDVQDKSWTPKYASRSHALRGNAFRDALRPAPQSGANMHSHAERGNEDMSLKKILLLLGTKRLVLWLPIIIFSIGCGLELLMIYFLNNGKLVYTFDDAYIHLAVAENIVKGHYGVNLNEFSASSSSIIWPFLLAPFTLLSIGDYMPLIINFLAATATLFLLSQILLFAFSPSDTKQSLVICLLVILLIPASNLMGLVFTGMEHSLQVFLAILLVFGLLTEFKTKTVPWWLLVAIICGPLVRYENLALGLPALIYLLFRGHYRAFSLTALILTASLASFSLFLYSLDFGFFPSSVIIKSGVVRSSGSTILRNLFHNLKMVDAALLYVGLFMLSWVLFSSSKERILAAWAAFALSIHLLVGRFDWYGRYDTYIWITVWLTLIYLYRDNLSRILKKESFYKIALFIILFLGTINISNVYLLFTTPLASNNIYEQQYQMHRFVSEYYQAPVAVNDLGWVSYRNDHYVLDFVGIGSKEALELRRTRDDAEWMDRLAKEHDVKLVMIYDWFPIYIPKNWILIGKLHLGKKKITAAGSVVTFYALEAETLSRTKRLLLEFRETLPKGVRLVVEKE